MCGEHIWPNAVSYSAAMSACEKGKRYPNLPILKKFKIRIVFKILLKTVSRLFSRFWLNNLSSLFFKILADFFGHKSASPRSFDKLSEQDKSYKTHAPVPALEDPEPQ